MKIPTKQTDNVEGAGFLATPKQVTKNTRLYAKLLEGFIYSASAFLLGFCALPFGTAPLGIAYLSAANKNIPYIFAGVALSALVSDEPFIMLAAYFAVLLVRVLVRLTLDTPWDEKSDSGEIELSVILPRLFSENVYLRMATSCIGVFAISLYSLIKGGFLYYDLFGAILSMVIAPLFVMATYGVFCEEERKVAYKYIAVAVIGFCLVYSTRELRFYGLSISALGGMLTTLYVCRKKGLLFGMGTGAVLGLAYSPALSPAFFLAALSAGALWRVSSIFACSAAFGIGMAFALYAKGISALTSFMPAMLAACLLFAVIDKTFLNKEIKSTNETKENNECVFIPQNAFLADNELSKVRLAASIDRQRTICDTFLSMSDFFTELGEKMKIPLSYDTKNICDSAFDAACTSCRCRSVCWEERRSYTSAALNTLSSSLQKNGKLEVNDVPDELRSVCERIPDLLDGINHNYSLHLRQLLLCDKTEIFATDYKAMSDMLSTGIELDGSEFATDSSLSARLCDVISENQLDISSSIVFGKKHKRVLLTAESAAELEEKKDMLLSLVERAVGKALVIEKIEDASGGAAVMQLCERKRISAEYATASSTSIFEKDFCGDSSAVFEHDNRMLYALISDGMGSGRDAALTSGICVMFLKKMLSACASAPSTLKLLNAFLRNKGSGSIHECSATLDLMELDTVASRASFYKSGAAASYVLREGKLFKLRSNTLPLGIIRELDTKKISFDIKPDDVIVMVSDGVTASNEDCPWLCELLKKNIATRSLRSCADMIIERAKSENDSDDITAILLKIKNNV